MPLWYRVFGRGSAPVDPAVLRDFVQGWMVPATAEFEPAGPDWLSATVSLPEREIHIERFRWPRKRGFVPSWQRLGGLSGDL